MSFIRFTNNARSKLVAPITNVATSLTVVAGEGAKFPALAAGDYYYATLQDALANLEIVKVTARAGDVFTVVRGQDGTTARAFATDDSIGSRVNAALLTEMTTDTALMYAIALG